MVQLLVRHSPGSLDQANKTGALPLHVAVRRLNPSRELIQFLVEERPGSVRRCDGQGRLAMDVAAAYRAPRDVLRLLQERRLDPNPSTSS
jgi:Ankyrin repeats (many copies)